MSIRPPDNPLELGTPVVYHHRACVARVPKRDKSPSVLDKTLFGASERENRWITVGEGRWQYALEEESPVKGMPFNGKRNKTIVCWPEDGEGIIIGLVRKGIGQSVAGHESGYEYPEWEPGYFDAEEWHWLYAVKGRLNGVNYLLVPMWAVQEK